MTLMFHIMDTLHYIVCQPPRGPPTSATAFTSQLRRRVCCDSILLIYIG